MEIYREHKIRKSGKMFFKVQAPDGHYFGSRVVSVAAAKATIDATIENRPYTREEYKIVYPELF